MRITLILYMLLVWQCSFAQCPNRDSLLSKRQAVSIIVPHYPPFYSWPYPISINAGTVAWTNSKPKIPLVNNDIKTNKRKIDRKGFVELYYPDRTDSVLLAKGRYVNGKKHGQWIWFFPDGDTLAKGKYVNGLKSGTWTEYVKNGNTWHIGSFVGGRKEGLWKTLSFEDLSQTESQRIQAKENYHLGLLHGKCKYYINGFLYRDLSYQMGWQQGKGVLYFAHADKQEDRKRVQAVEYCLDGRLHGKYYSYDLSGRILTKYNYDNGIQSGLQYTWNYDEETNEVFSMKKNLRNGWTLVYSKGQLKQKTYFLNDQKNGLHWLIEGNQKSIEHYKGGVLHGFYEVYNKDEKGSWVLMTKTSYVNGILNGKDYRRQGEITYVKRYTKGKLNGFCYALMGNDTISSEWYINNLQHGKSIRNEQQFRYETLYQDGLRLVEKMIVLHDTTKNTVNYYHNDYVFDKKNASYLPNGWLLEKQFDDKGNLIGERVFSPLGGKPDTATFITYHPNGQIKETSSMIDHRFGGIHRKFNQLGDTILYINYYTKEGRVMTSSWNWIEKGYWINGQLEGDYELWVYDTSKVINCTFEDTAKLYLAAKGEMYKGEAFGTWTYYDKTGNIWYEGCHCGLYRYLEINHGGFHYYDLTTGREIDFKGGVCGDYVWHHSNGKIYKEKHGSLYSEYDVNGNLLLRGNFINELREGVWEFYDSTGSKIQKNYLRDQEVAL